MSGEGRAEGARSGRTLVRGCGVTKIEWPRLLHGADLGDGGMHRVALVIWDAADADGGRSFLANATIAKRVNMSERVVRRHLRALEAAGWIILEKSGGDRRGKSRKGVPPTNIYRLGPGPTAGKETGGNTVRGDSTVRPGGQHRPPTGDSTVREPGTAPSPYQTQYQTQHPTHDPTQGSDRWRDRGQRGASAASIPADERSEVDVEVLVDDVAGRVHGFEGVEESTARGMLESGSPVQVVVNTIGKQRLRRTA